MFRSDLKLTICYLSCFLQERKLVFSQGGFLSREFLVSTDWCVWNKSEAAAAAAPPERSDPKYIYSFGFPQIVRAHDFLCIAPPRLAHVFCHVSELIPARHMAFVHVSCGDQLRHMAKYMCQPRGGLYTKNRARAHDLGKPLRSNACAFLWHFCTSCSTQNHESRVWDRSDSTQNGGNTEYDRKQRVMKQPKKKYREVYACAYKEHEMNWLQLICSISSEISN